MRDKTNLKKIIAICIAVILCGVFGGKITIDATRDEIRTTIDVNSPPLEFFDVNELKEGQK